MSGRVRLRLPEWGGPDWFDLSIGWLGPVAPWCAFRSVTADGSAWSGFGLLQIGTRHLFFIGNANGHDQLCVLFFWVVGSHR